MSPAERIRRAPNALALNAMLPASLSVDGRRGDYLLCDRGSVLARGDFDYIRSVASRLADAADPEGSRW